MTMGEEIRRRRKALKWTLEELANRIGTDTGNLSRLERGKQGYTNETLHKVARALGCSVSELFAGSASESNAVSVPIGARRIPLIDYVQAGAWSEVADQHAMESGHASIITDLDLSSQAFALEIKGESMLPEFRPGDKIIVDPAITPEPGDFVIAVSSTNAVEFKQYRPRGINTSGEQVFELAPLNDNFPSMRSDVTPIVIIGTMVEHRRYRRKQ